jgi:hypothetical protein
MGARKRIRPALVQLSIRPIFRLAHRSLGQRRGLLSSTGKVNKSAVNSSIAFGALGVVKARNLPMSQGLIPGRKASTTRCGAWSISRTFGLGGKKLPRSAIAAAHPIEKPGIFLIFPSSNTGQTAWTSIFRTSRRLNLLGTSTPLVRLRRYSGT